MVGNFFGSIAPTFWANKIDINAMFYEDYGVKMYSIVLACKRATLQNKPDVCKGVVEGLMEGLKFVYLNPEKAIDLHVESLKEFQGGSPGTREVLDLRPGDRHVAGLRALVQGQRSRLHGP